MLEPFQVAEARLHGADAILLILAAVDDLTWRACAELAARLQMEVLTEVHDETEADRAVELGAGIIGVNNRDLSTLAVDLGTTPRLAPRIPAGRLVIAESGIATRGEVAALRPFADAFLVGGALMRESDLDAAVRRLVYGVTKVCGLTRAEDARAAWRAGATHGGLVFAPGSPRLVTREQADLVRRAAPLEWVGVFADQRPEDIATIANQLDLSAVQLHGRESPDVVARVRTLVPERCAVWKAVRVNDRVPLRAGTGADRLLLDGSPPVEPETESRRSMSGPATTQLGGTGYRFDWALLDGYPERSDVFLAGGLRAENVAHAVALGVYGLDVSSGVEASPGRKDSDRLAAFFRARRRISGRGDRSP
jgi:indole-3-glycerol phosphate synthase/phosphoribosylanthranilate isomerase